MLVSVGERPKQPLFSASVKLRRKNRTENDLESSEASRRRNRHSGDFSHWSPSRRLQEERKLSRKSGDWSYVGFPASQLTTVGIEFETGRGIPNQSGRYQRRESDDLFGRTNRAANSVVLENKVLTSLVQKETSSPNASKASSASKDLETARCNSAMETLDRKTGSDETSSISRRRIKDSTRNGVNADMQGSVRKSKFCEDGECLVKRSTADGDRSRRGKSGREGDANCKRRSRSQPRPQQHYQHTEHPSGPSDGLDFLLASDSRSVTSAKTPSVKEPRGGLGRRSATQLELSNRQKAVCNGHGHEGGDCLKQRRKRWTSSEHIREALVRLKLRSWLLY